MYTQNHEEHYILNYFADQKQGRFLDLGSFDGMTFSNTFALYELGWHGVFVEASPKIFTALQRNCNKGRETLVNACLTCKPVSGMITFYDNDQATATTDISHVEKWKAQTPFSPIMVMPVHINSIIATFGSIYDMVSLDIEGQSAEMFMQLFPMLPDVRLWVVEHDNRQEEIRALAKGFNVLYENGENLVLAK